MYTPVFYDKRMNVEGLDSYSPSAGKPARFCELLAHYDYRSYAPQHLGRVTPITKEDLYRVHDRDHVDSVFSLRTPNGFGNCDPRVPESTLWTIGSLLTASRRAMKYPAIAACAPVSGFHHADYSDANAFCTFNGLIVVAAKLIEENPHIKISLLDCDAHFADGSHSLLKRHRHLGKQVLHFTSGQHFYGDDKQEDALDFQVWLKSAIEEINEYKPDLVIYQAGADAWEMDDLKSGYLSIEQLKQRDRDVFTGIKAPISFVLAGGYSKSPDNSIFTDPVLQIHRNTLIESDKSLTVRKQWWPEDES